LQVFDIFIKNENPIYMKLIILKAFSEL